MTKHWLERVGLVIGGYGPGRPLAWGVNHGFMLRWPRWVKTLILRTWNWVNCRVAGHAPFRGRCVNCRLAMPGRSED